MSDRKIKRITSIKILGVLIDEHVTKKELVTVIENKVSKKCRLPNTNPEGYWIMRH